MGYVKLFQAAGKGDVATLIEALDGGATGPNPTSVIRRSTTPALWGNRMLCELFWSAGESELENELSFTVDGRRENGVVVLMYARSADVVTALVAAGADVNAADDKGRTPLIHASHWGKDDVVRALLDSGADASLPTKDGHTALDVARFRSEGYRSMATEQNNDAVAQRVKAFEQILSLFSAYSH